VKHKYSPLGLGQILPIPFMIAIELVNQIIPPLKSTDTVKKAIQWMEEFRVSQLPLIAQNEYKGLILESVLYDCNDENADINPAAIEICDAIDNNCDGLIEAMPTIDTLYFVPDSLVSEPNTIYVVYQGSNTVQWEWFFGNGGNGTSSNEQYPTITFPTSTFTSQMMPINLYAISINGCQVYTSINFLV
jgi:hypothetical protein